MAAPTNGTIKRLVSEKGFGFVAASDGSEYFLPPVRMQRLPVRQPPRGTGRDLRKGSGAEGSARRERSPRVMIRSFRLKAEATRTELRKGSG